MEFSLWEREYCRILEDLGLSRERDEAAAILLATLLQGKGVGVDRLEEIVRGRSVVVVGAAPGSSPFPLPDGEWRIVAADGATTACLENGTLPELIVTDLDGYLPHEVKASGEGSVVLVHAHGDNIAALRKWVPKFPGEIAGSASVAPHPPLLNFGGFTDGDRAVFLAEALGAEKVLLTGFDFAFAVGKNSEKKLRKLRVAARLIDQVAARGQLPIYLRTDRGAHRWIPITR